MTKNTKRAFDTVTLASALAMTLAACSGGGGGGESGADGGQSGTTPSPTPAPAPGGSTPTPTPGGSTPAPTPAPQATSTIDSEPEAVRFLNMATFGSDEGAANDLNGDDASEWIQREFSRDTSEVLPQLLERAAAGEEIERRDATLELWENMIGGDDQLRQRMVFALSQILVVSDANGSPIRNEPLTMAHFADILSRNAFGNYRDLLEEVTYSPAMGRYLTYLRNRKGDEKSGRVPDENYAREIMQLFTIGVIELNEDGTPRLGSDGQVIETYTNDDVTGLAKVFTGLSYKGTEFFGDKNADNDADYSPMQIFPEFHSELEKTFLGTTIPAGTSAEESIDIALDALVDHPNTPPFIARQMIQRFVTSDPSPAYVRRVADAFAAGTFTLPNGDRVGDGRRGDLRATIAAVLTDADVLGPNAGVAADYGKVREPVLRFVQWARAFDVRASDALNERWLDGTESSSRLSQHPLRATSVFNFYRPGYVAPGTETGEAGLTAPELQIVNESTLIGYVNFMSRYVRDDTPNFEKMEDTPSFRPDYSDEIALAEDPAALADHLDTLLTGGRMSVETKNRIIAVLKQIPINSDSVEENRLDRVELAVLMAVTSPAYIVQR
ncbi:MAG: DUF1800 domain-containing protein [Pseudomonadota bacterium]